MKNSLTASRLPCSSVALEPGEEICDISLDALHPDLYFEVFIPAPSRITVEFKEFNSASRCLLLLSPSDPHPTSETAVWRLSSPDPQKKVVLHPADHNYPTKALFIAVRYLEMNGSTSIRMRVTLERNFFATYFHRHSCDCRLSLAVSVKMAAAASVYPGSPKSIRRLSERIARTSSSADGASKLDNARVARKRSYNKAKKNFREYLEGDIATCSDIVVEVDELQNDDDHHCCSSGAASHEGYQQFTRSSLYCGEWEGHLPHGRGIRFYAVSAVGQVVLEKASNAAMLVRTEFEQHSIPWTANSMQEPCEKTMLQRDMLQAIDLNSLSGWSIIPLMERGMEAYDGYWEKGEKSGKGIYQWQDRVYYGEWKMGLREGYGVLERQDGSWYRGEWHLDFRHGTGTSYDVETRKTYTGEWNKGVRSGKGRLAFDNGVTVTGEWNDDTLGSTVHASFSDGSTYEGGWEDDCRHGQGIWTTDRKCVYTNTWKKDQKEGSGTISFPNGVIFNGTWEEDRVVEGAYYFTNGDVYVGEWRNDTWMREGCGKCICKNGDIYEGEWLRDLRHGHGKMTYASGKGTYEGSWVEGVRHGHGVLQDSNGVYEGTFVVDERSGDGIQRGSDGSYYEGGWKHDFRAGPGVYYYAPDDTTYEGIFLHDRLQGKGVSTVRSSHDSFEGTWLDGLKQGHGTRYFPNGDILRGVWHRGDPQNGEVEYTYTDGTKYVGEWCDGQHQGQGTLFSRDGTVYSGAWLQNQPHGHGTLTRSDGSSVECEWEKGRQLDGDGILTFGDGSVYTGDVVNGIPEGTGVLRYPDQTEFKGQFRNGTYCL